MSSVRKDFYGNKSSGRREGARAPHAMPISRGNPIMIPAFELVTPEAVSDERLFALMHRMHQISLELGRVYDVVLYQTECSKGAPRGVPYRAVQQWH